MSKKQILFVYNAKSGAMNGLLDYGKKYIQPSKYDCQLCMLSYGPFGMKKDWKDFTSSLPYIVSFLHKDDLEKMHPHIKVSLPAVVLTGGNQSYETIITSDDFLKIKSLDELKESLEVFIKNQKKL